MFSPTGHPLGHPWKKSRKSIAGGRERQLDQHRSTRNDERLHGVVVVFKQTEMYGFIKAHRSLPEGFTNKNVHFRSYGNKYNPGDEVEFVLRDSDKFRPHAIKVWLKRRNGPLEMQLLNEEAAYTQGQITYIDTMKKEGYIQVVGNVDTEHRTKNLESVYFQQSWVSCSHMDLLPGDMLEFKLRPSKRRHDEV